MPLFSTAEIYLKIYDTNNYKSGKNGKMPDLFSKKTYFWKRVRLPYTNRFKYYIIQQLFNDVKVPHCHTENLSFENIFSPFKYSLLLFSRFYFLGYKYKGHDFLRADAFAPVASPSATPAFAI